MTPPSPIRLSETSCDDLAAVLEQKDTLGYGFWRAGSGSMVKTKFAMEIFTEALLAGRTDVPDGLPLLPLTRISATLAARRGVHPVALATLAMQLEDMTVVSGDDVIAFTHQSLASCSVYHPGICWMHLDRPTVRIDDRARHLPETLLTRYIGEPLSALMSHVDYDDLGLMIRSVEPDTLGESLIVEVEFDGALPDRAALKRMWRDAGRTA